MNLNTAIVNLNEGITEQHIMEGISRAFVTAVAHATGLNIEVSAYDYGLDGTFSSVKVRKNRRVADGYKLDFQLKASTNIILEDEYVKYNLESKNYNDLVDIDVGTPRILILYKLPILKNEWLNVCESGILLKDCAWWYSLHGLKETTNSQTVTIRIPRKQILNIDTLGLLMSKVKERGEL
jgi:hypothetical protein